MSQVHCDRLEVCDSGDTSIDVVVESVGIADVELVATAVVNVMDITELQRLSSISNSDLKCKLFLNWSDLKRLRNEAIWAEVTSNSHIFKVSSINENNFIKDVRLVTLVESGRLELNGVGLELDIVVLIHLVLHLFSRDSLI